MLASRQPKPESRAAMVHPPNFPKNASVNMATVKAHVMPEIVVEEIELLCDGELTIIEKSKVGR